jgi:hypothetical protein
MHTVARFSAVIALGSLLSAVTILVLWPILRGSVLIAAGLAFPVASMSLVDDLLARRPPVVWRAIAMGALSGATAWATLALLGT